MSSTFVPGQTGFTRVFLIDGRARGDHTPDYEHQLKMMSVEQSFGDVTNIYTPHPEVYDKFLVIGSVRAEEERPTTQLMGRYAADLRSELLRLAKLGCAVDVQLHIGRCTNPADFNEFEKILIFEEAFIPNWATDDLGALQPDEKALINETADISAVRLYEVLPISIAERAGDIVTQEVLDVVICDTIACGDCEDASDGCQKIFAISDSAAGSPGTPADVVWSLDGGVNFFARDIDTLSVGESPTGVACIDTYLVVTADDSSHHITLLEDFDEAATVLQWSEVAGYSPEVPNDIWSTGLQGFVVGTGGFVWRILDPTQAPEELDAGVATADDLNAVHAIGEDFAVAGGNNGSVVFSTNGVLWQAASSAPSADNILAVWAKTEDEWWVGTDAGQLFYTLDEGVSWREKTFPSSGSGQVTDIAFASDSVAYLAHEPAGQDGRLLRSYDGGHSWNILPEGVGIVPANDGFTALAACAFDPNFVVAGGVGDGGADGILIIGSD